MLIKTIYDHWIPYVNLLFFEKERKTIKNLKLYEQCEILTSLIILEMQWKWRKD